MERHEELSQKYTLALITNLDPLCDWIEIGYSMGSKAFDVSVQMKRAEIAASIDPEEGLVLRRVSGSVSQLGEEVKTFIEAVREAFSK